MMPEHPQKLPYDPLKDFAPITLVAGVPWVLVASPTLPVKTRAGTDRHAKARPGQAQLRLRRQRQPAAVAMASCSRRTPACTWCTSRTRARRWRPSDVANGSVAMLFDSLASVQPHIKAGRVRPLAVNPQRRSALLPEVPTLAEAGMPAFDRRTWSSLVAPAGTPKEIVDRLNAEVVKAVNAPDVREKLIAQGLEALLGSPPEQVTQWTKAGLARMSEIVKRADIKGE